MENKDKWIIKPYDSYSSKGVYAGIDYNEQEWFKIIQDVLWEVEESKLGFTGYLMQQYCIPYKSTNIDFSEKDPEFKEFSNITGLFCYNEKMKGIYSRLSNGGIISSMHNEKTVASIVLKSSLDTSSLI